MQPIKKWGLLDDGNTTCSCGSEQNINYLFLYPECTDDRAEMDLEPEPICQILVKKHTTREQPIMTLPEKILWFIQPF